MLLHKCQAIVYDRILYDVCQEFDNRLVGYEFRFDDVKRAIAYKNDDPMNRNMLDFTGTQVYFYDGTTTVIDTPFEVFSNKWENSLLFLN